MSEVLNKSNVLYFPSVTENFGNSLVEGVAYGLLPCIYHDTHWSVLLENDSAILEPALREFLDSDVDRSVLFDMSTKVQDVVLFPVVNRDLNFKFDSSINLGEVCASMKSINQSILQDVLPVDIYQSKEENNKKNVLFNLSFQSVKKTLEDNDVNAVIAEIINVVTKKFNAKLRDN